MNETNIIEILPSGLLYRDEHDENQFIDFANCYQNYLAGWDDPEQIAGLRRANPTLSDEGLEQSLSNIRAFPQVGESDFGYALFYTEPITKFTFTNEDARITFFLAVHGSGWALYDWT